jgi:hypothetical protein
VNFGKRFPNIMRVKLEFQGARRNIGPAEEKNSDTKGEIRGPVAIRFCNGPSGQNMGYNVCTPFDPRHRDIVETIEIPSTLLGDFSPTISGKLP